MTEAAWLVGIDVLAGVVPGHPMPEYTRRFFLTSREWYDAGSGEHGPLKQAELLADLNSKAQAWAMYLMLQPDRVNWVRTDWVWF